MGFEGGGANAMRGLRLAARHKRSKSLPDKKIEEHNSDVYLDVSGRLELMQDMGHLKDFAIPRKSSPKRAAQNSLKQEILLLEKRLKNQFEIRSTLEKALGYGSASLVNPDDNIMPKPATELVKEIAVLELEVVYLEQHLLSLYRKAFDQQISSVSPTAKDEEKSPTVTPRAKFVEVSKPNVLSKNVYSTSCAGNRESVVPLKESKGSVMENKQLDSSVHRSRSSLSQCSPFTNQTSKQESLDKALRACHSQPLSMMEYAQNASSNMISLAEHLGTRISDHVQETPNRISEEMVKCMSTIYCKLADPPLTHNGLSSPSSSMSSASAFSPQHQGDMWSPGFRNSSFDVHLDNPFLVEGLKEFSGPYSTMIEIPWIQRDGKKLGNIEELLQIFKSLIGKLVAVNLGKLKHEEKLAFWVNVHNALVMHAFLAYGIPQNNLKRLLLLMKAAYNIGGRTVSAATIQNNILGCRMPRPGQWLRLLLSSRTKFKPGDERLAIEHSEPLLYFALCSGNHSDPAVRVYTPKRVFQELVVAKEEYIRATFGARKDQKILLPKVVESFAKDAGLCPAGLIEVIQKSLPDSFKKTVKKCQQGKAQKVIEWIPHNFTFRFLISKEAVK